jgi:NTE family protein
VTTFSWSHRAEARRRRQDAAEVVTAGDWPYRHAIVCSGGGNLGAAQVGMLRALLEEGIRPDLMVGCSVGALNAAYLAIDPTLERVRGLEEIWRSIGTGDVFAGNRRSMAAHLIRRHPNLFDAEGLRALIARSVLIEDLADTTVPLHVVTTDLEGGGAAWWTSGNPVDVLAASACLPGLFPPVNLGNGLHVDGGVLCPVPVGRALELGAETVWVLDVSGERSPVLPARPTALDVLLASFAIARRQLLLDAVRSQQPGQRVVTITLDAPTGLDVRDFRRTDDLIQEGYEVACSLLTEERIAVAAG